MDKNNKRKSDEDINKIVSKEKLTEEDVNILTEWVIEVCDETQRDTL
jgi:hypothetical protein